jgi:DNA-directed RNA polymerase
MIWSTLTEEEKFRRADQQLSFEQEMLDYGKHKYWKDYDRSPDEGIPEQELIDSSVKELEDVYQEWIDQIAMNPRSPQWVYPLMELGSRKMADITIRAIVRAWFSSSFWSFRWKHGEDLHTPPLAQTIATQIAQDACDIISFQRAKQDYKDDWKKQSKFIKNWTTKRCRAFALKVHKNIKLSIKQKHDFGHHMLRIAVTSNIILLKTQKIKTRRGKFRNYTFVEFHPDVLRELHRRHDILQNSTLIYRPMLVPPNDHTLVSSGGYISTSLRKPVVQRYKSNYFGEVPKEQKFSTPSPLVLRGLNALQKTEWAVNEDVFSVMSTLFMNNTGIANLPYHSFNEFMHSEEYPKEGTKEEQAIWCQKRESCWSEWYKQEQARGRMLVRLNLAGDLIERGFFYHVYSLDFRGRAYTTCELLSPQSSDVDRGLIRFAEGVELTEEGRYWQKIHLANVFDQDKETLDDRIQWVEDNWDMILRIAKDPYENREWIDNAKKKNKSFQRLASVFDITRNDNLTFVPVQVDGKCNGNQHWSAIMGDEDIAKLVGVLPSLQPQDLYQYVADKTTEYCNLHRPSNEWFGNFLSHWDRGIDRKVTKRSTMCEPYGLTFYGIQRYIKVEGHLDWVPDNKIGGAVVELSRAIKAALDLTLQEANKGKAWLKEVSSIASDLNKHLEWVTPSGFKVSHYYNKISTRRSLAKMFNNKQLTFHVKTDDVNPRTASQAIAPNYIHSLDAAHMFLTIDRMIQLGIYNLSMIHDSYGCYANYVGTMQRLIREEFIRIHKENQLDIFKLHIENKLGVILPDPPPRGILDIDMVTKSLYFFS